MLCAVWTTYLFLLIVKNPGIPMEYLYTIFGQYSQYDRDMVILQFMYFINKLGISTDRELGIDKDGLDYLQATKSQFPLPIV